MTACIHVGMGTTACIHAGAGTTACIHVDVGMTTCIHVGATTPAWQNSTSAFLKRESKPTLETEEEPETQWQRAAACFASLVPPSLRPMIICCSSSQQVSGPPWGRRGDCFVRIHSLCRAAYYTVPGSLW